MYSKHKRTDPTIALIAGSHGIDSATVGAPGKSSSNSNVSSSGNSNNNASSSSSSSSNNSSDSIHSGKEQSAEAGALFAGSTKNIDDSDNLNSNSRSNSYE